jgi:uncharacterized protein YndB with AHSA1/START domain
VSFTPHTINPELDLELIREVPVPPEAVFAAWTDPESLKQWFAPRPYSISECEVDLRPGGGFRTAMASPEGEQLFDNTGCILEVVPNERLVWSDALTTGFRPQESPMPFTAVLELRPNGSGGCHYRAIAIHQDPDGRKQHEEMGFHDGWGTVVDQMVEHIQAAG